METPNAEQPAEKERTGSAPEAPAGTDGAREDAAQAQAAQPGGETKAAADAAAAPAAPAGAAASKNSGARAGGAPGVGGLRPSDVDFMPGLLRSLSVRMRRRGTRVSPQLLLAGLSGSQIPPRAAWGRRARRAFPGASPRARALTTSRRWCCPASSF